MLHTVPGVFSCILHVGPHSACLVAMAALILDAASRDVICHNKVIMEPWKLSDRDQQTKGYRSVKA